MISLRMLGNSSTSLDQRTRLLEAALILAGALAISAFILKPMTALAVGIGCLALWFAGMIGSVLSGRVDRMVLWWAAVFPLGYYFTSFPRQQAIVTLDRVVVCFVFLALFVAKPHSILTVPSTLRRAGFAVFAFVALTALTLTKSASPLNSARALLDSFLLPVLLGWAVIALFDVRSYLPALHSSVCISSIISALVAVAEVVTSQDLLSIGAPMASYADIIRPNGPFESNDSLALIGAISLFLLLFLRQGLGPRLSNGRRILHLIGLTAAIGMALLPLFRSVALTLFVVLIIDAFWERGTRRAWRFALVFLFVGMIFVVAVLAPEVFEDRSGGGNVYARVAQFEQNMQVFKEHPLLGIGLMNFHDYVADEPNYVFTYDGVSSVDWPHNNLAQILTETGALGFLPYLMIQFFLLRAMWQLRRFYGSGGLAWRVCLYLFLTYWITGLTESSGYGPLNLWYAFAVAVIFKYALTEPELVEQSGDVADEAPEKDASEEGFVFNPALLR